MPKSLAHAIHSYSPLIPLHSKQKQHRGNRKTSSAYRWVRELVVVNVDGEAGYGDGKDANLKEGLVGAVGVQIRGPDTENVVLLVQL